MTVFKIFTSIRSYEKKIVPTILYTYQTVTLTYDPRLQKRRITYHIEAVFFFFPREKKSSPRENFQDSARENLQVPEKKS